MQNRFVADIGDYVKLSIIRALIRERHECRLGVAWWLLPDEPDNGDGGHREYLRRPGEWKRFDPDLFEALAKIDNEKERNVCALESAGLLPNAVFARDPVPCDLRPFAQRPLERKRWLSEIKAKLDGCNLVFLDPDNGIAPEGWRLTWRRAGKSVMVEEIIELAQRGRAMVVYHHQTRREGGHLSEICHLASRLARNGLEVSGALRARPWSPRVFFVLNGDEELQNRAKSIAELWENRISWHSDIGIMRNSK